MKRVYGFKKGIIDDRDFKFGIVHDFSLPELAFLSNKAAILNQLGTSSCTAHAIACTIDSQLVKPYFPSRLFIYFNERDIENVISEDSGASIRDGIKSINKQGVCSESSWIFDPSQVFVRPSSNAYSEALNFKVSSYAGLENNDANNLRSSIVSGHAIMFGFNVYESFEGRDLATTGVMKMPLKGERLLGGHAVACIGYKPGYFLIQNSWGVAWGDKGCFWMPEQFITSDECSDFWTIDLPQVKESYAHLSVFSKFIVWIKNIYSKFA